MKWEPHAQINHPRSFLSHIELQLHRDVTPG